MIKNIPYYITGSLIFLLLKFIYMQAGTDTLLFLLSPTDWLVSLLTGSKGSNVAALGFVHKDLNIVIEKSCAGFNFFLLISIISYFLCLQFFTKTWFKLLLLPLSFLLGWILTIGVNASRICTAILLQRTLAILPSSKWFHEALGSFIYLFFLLVFYKTLHYLLIKYLPKNEKFA